MSERKTLNGTQVNADGAELRSDRPALIPSLLYVVDGTQGQTVAGSAVRAHGLDQRADNRLFRNFKRRIAAFPASPPRRIYGAQWGDRDAGRLHPALIGRGTAGGRIVLLRYLDNSTGAHAYDEIIPAGARYPSDHPVEVVLSAAHADQAAIELVIGEISTDAVALVEVQYTDGQAVFVAKADESQQQIKALNGGTPTVISLKPSGDPGEDRIKVAFTVDAERNLCVTVTDLKTRKWLLCDQVIAALR